MRIEALSERTRDSAYALCTLLKTQDEHPCSFWGYSREEFSLPRPDKITLVCNNDEQVIGLGTLCKGGPFQDHWAEISLALHPQFRKQGIAQQLLLALEEQQRAFKIEFIKALILENNASSRKFFSRMGYEHKATLFHDFKILNHGNLSDCAYYKIFASGKILPKS